MVVGTPTVLNLIPGKVFPVVNVNQYDAGYQKTFLLYKGSEPFKIAANMSVTIRGTKGDKHGIADSAASTRGSNRVSVTLTEQMTAVAGPNIYELRIVNTSGLLIGTINFILMVEPAALGDDTVISDSDLNYAVDVLDELQSVEAFKNQLDSLFGMNHITDFGLVKEFRLPIYRSYVEAITYDTNRDLFYMGINNMSGTGDKSQIISINGSTYEQVAVHNYAFGTIGTLSYNPVTDQIYVALTGSAYQLYYVNAETMESGGVLTDKTFSVGVQYDIEEGVNVALQLSAGSAEVRTYDADWEEIESYTVQTEDTDLPQQGFAAHGGKIYVATWNSLLEIDYKGGAVSRRIRLAGYLRGNAEPEDFAFKGDDIYLASQTAGVYGFAQLYQYGVSSADNVGTHQFYNTVWQDISIIYRDYKTLFDYIQSLPSNTSAYLFRYGTTNIFEDLPTLYDSVAVIIQIRITKMSFDPAYTFIELDINRTGADIRKRWRGVIKTASATAITWYEQDINTIMTDIKDVYPQYNTLFSYISALPVGTNAYLYSYDIADTFTDLPDLYSSQAVGIQIHIIKPSTDPAFTLIELEVNRTSNTVSKRWRGVILLSSSTSITWKEYVLEPTALGTPVSSEGTIQYFHGTKLADNIVAVSLHLNLTAAKTINTIVATGLPEQWASNTPVFGFDNQNGEMIPLTLGSDGSLRLRADTKANASLRLNFTYLAKP